MDFKERVKKYLNKEEYTEKEKKERDRLHSFIKIHTGTLDSFSKISTSDLYKIAAVLKPKNKKNKL